MKRSLAPRSPIKTSLVALALVAAVDLVQCMIFVGVLRSHLDGAHILDISGAQRMRTQRIAYLAATAHAADPDPGWRAELAQAAAGMAAAEREIAQRPAFAFVPPDMAGHGQWTNAIDAYLEAAAAIGRRPADQAPLRTIRNLRPRLFAGFQAAVEHRAAIVTTRTNRLVVALLVGLGIQFASIYGVWAGLIKPAERRRREALEAREAAQTALRVSDELFRQVEEHTPIGLGLVAVDGTFMRVNPALCTLTGYCAADLLTMGPAALVDPDDAADADRRVADLADGTVDSYAAETRYRRRDGRAIWTLTSSSIVRDERGGTRFTIVQLQDIGPQKDAQEAIVRAQRAALAGAQAKSRFLATMSHELRTPMNGIIGMTEILAMSTLSNEQRGQLDIVRESSQSLLRILNDILDYSKIDAGKLDLAQLDFEVDRQLRSVTSLMAPQFAAKNIAFTTDVAPDVATWLHGDPERLRQILLNLVNNAHKFTPDGGSVALSVTVADADEAGQRVRFAVSDTGIGIAPNVRHRLFVPFSQVDGSSTRRYGGTGLGLSICRQLVDLMGGSIGVDSMPANGSVFWFTIPLAHATAVHARVDVAVPRPPRERWPLQPRRTERILLVEDNLNNALVAAKQFDHLGFAVSMVTDGEQALKALADERFAVVFMDCQMPNMDGYEATAEIRRLPGQTHERTPIVAMTAGGQAEDIARCMTAGMDDYVVKPVTLSDLGAVLDRWLPGTPDAAAARGASSSRALPLAR